MMTVQFAPLAKLLVPQLSVEIVKSAEFVPPSTGAEQLVAEPVPEFNKVKV